MRNEGRSTLVRVTGAVNVLLGLWLVVSPWVIGSPASAISRSAMGVGVLIALSAAIRLSARKTSILSYLNILFAGWAIVSPWVFGTVTGDARTWNYVIVGMAVVALEGLSLTASALWRPWSPSSGVSSGSSGHTRKPG
ncbi:MAG: repeat protein [Gammaproteobacteria bacterium]|nr:repeat protein [Gammaproteobacteria bacterium]